jgi:hypothetical protein
MASSLWAGVISNYVMVARGGEYTAVGDVRHRLVGADHTRLATRLSESIDLAGLDDRVAD